MDHPTKNSVFVGLDAAYLNPLALKDEEHYKFPCRCGCGAIVAGFGKDIKSAARIGQSDKDPNTRKTSVDVNHEIAASRAEFAMKVRPFVSDRYIQKAIFKLTDDEIDAISLQRSNEGNVDPVIAAGGGADGHEPPEVGVTVYSKVTGQGPYTVMDFTMARIEVGEGVTAQIHQTYCAVLRNKSGNYITIPVGDLVKRLPEVSRSDNSVNVAPKPSALTAARSVFNNTLVIVLAGWMCMAVGTLICLSMLPGWL